VRACSIRERSNAASIYCAQSGVLRCHLCLPKLLPMARRQQQQAIKIELKIDLAVARREIGIRAHRLRSLGVRQRAGFRSVITAGTQAGFVRATSRCLCAVGRRHGLVRARIGEFLLGLGDAGRAVVQPLIGSRVVIVGPAGRRAIQNPVKTGIVATCDNQGCQSNPKDCSHNTH
jgi:hypothetical protein